MASTNSSSNIINNIQQSVQANIPSLLNQYLSKAKPAQNPASTPFFLQRPLISSELASKLIPIDVDFHTKKNTEEHSTNHYDTPGLVLRRGQPFSFTVTFNKEFDSQKYQLYIRLATGSRSMISKRTQIRLLVDGTPTGNGWSAKVIPTEINEGDEKKKNRISIQVSSPSGTIIGKYILLLETRPIEPDANVLLDKQNLTLFLFEIDIYFLFNPWNKDDSCSLKSIEEINEYVMNEHGQIYLGTSDKPHAVSWYFGQFEKPALLTALTLLDKALLPEQNRYDPAIIIRSLSSRICSNPGTNNGIFPSALDTRTASHNNNDYTSSSLVLKQYQLSNGRSIVGGSGYNWQHAAILCTLSRALGIPCRIVTVYNAANRIDGSENNDVHWDTKQRPLKQLNSDMTCTTHVWNECWMRRFDLSTNEQDWQIIDSTPIQKLDGVQRLGPCSATLLKKGDLGFQWDSPSIYSLINGNKSHWFVHPDGNMELLDVQENIIGNKILTRTLTNEFESDDMTVHYKNSINSKNLQDRLKNDVDIELKVPDDILFGDSILFELHVKNKSNESRTITTCPTVYIANSTSRRFLSFVDLPVQTLNLESDKNDIIKCKITPEQYVQYGRSDSILIKYFIHLKIKETNQTFVHDDNVSFNRVDIVKPILEEDVIEIGKPVKLGVQIANTLSRPISYGRVHIDGLGINQIIPINRSFAPKESTVFYVNLNPTRIGVSRLYVTFVSNDICSFTQSIPLEIVREPIRISDEPLLKSSASNKQNGLSGNEQPKSVVIKSDNENIQSSNVSSNKDENHDETSSNQKEIHSSSNLEQQATTLDKDQMSIDSLDIHNDGSHSLNRIQHN